MPENTFEAIKKIDDNGKEYWSSRELARALEYADYRNFLGVIERAKIACENSGEIIHNHFVEANEMVKIGSGAEIACKNSGEVIHNHFVHMDEMVDEMVLIGSGAERPIVWWSGLSRQFWSH